MDQLKRPLCTDDSYTQVVAYKVISGPTKRGRSIQELVVHRFYCITILTISRLDRPVVNTLRSSILPSSVGRLSPLEEGEGTRFGEAVLENTSKSVSVSPEYIQYDTLRTADLDH